MKVLGIETSCDETAAAVVDGPFHVLSNVVHTQAAAHRPYGGVVPEIASRNHAEHLPAVIEAAMTKAGATWSAIDCVAATRGPGLATSLIVGLSAAKALALRLGKPLAGIHHLEAHLFSVFMAPDAPPPEEACPLVALIVSGGHTCLVRMDSLGQYRLLGRTQDDAAGEAFDKGAKLLGLGYPGGPAIERAAADGDPAFVRFPRSAPSGSGPNPGLDFSFSGLKTALLYHLQRNPTDKNQDHTADLAASYQAAIVDALVARTALAADREKVVCVAAAGGVSLNGSLRHRLGHLARLRGARLLLAPPAYCADNAAMVAGLAAAGAGIRGPATMPLDISPTLPFGDA